MKTMTCKELGGACDMTFTGNNFEEIAAQSKQHGMEMYKQGDKPHLEAMQAMQQVMSGPEKMKAWMDEKKKAFEAAPEN